jgi:hypothetical protein
MTGPHLQEFFSGPLQVTADYFSGEKFPPLGDEGECRDKKTDLVHSTAGTGGLTCGYLLHRSRIHRRGTGKS